MIYLAVPFLSIFFRGRILKSKHKHIKLNRNLKF